jgi:hypothetical protein
MSSNLIENYEIMTMSFAAEVIFFSKGVAQKKKKVQDLICITIFFFNHDVFFSRFCVDLTLTGTILFVYTGAVLVDFGLQFVQHGRRYARRLQKMKF